MTSNPGRKPVIGMVPRPLPAASLANATHWASFTAVSSPSETSGLDAFIIADSVVRVRLIEEAIEAGARAVLCQSPLAATVEEAREIVDLCASRGVQLAVAFPYRYSPAFKRLREQVQAGAAGDVLAIRAESRGATQAESALRDRVVAALDMISHLIGRNATRVYAEPGNGLRGGDGEETVLFTIRYGDIFCTLDVRLSRANSSVEPGDVTVQVVGTGGVLDLDMFSQALTRRSAEDGRVSYIQWGSDIGSALISDFARLVAGEASPNLATGADGLRAMETVSAAYRSVERGEPIEIAHHEEDLAHAQN